MAKPEFHGRLSRTDERWLLSRAYPGHSAPTAVTADEPGAIDVNTILKAAQFHGVLPAVIRAAESEGLAAERSTAAVSVGEMRSARLTHAYLIGHSMLLTVKGDEVISALRSAGVAVTAVKGAAFARVLYPDPTFRTFTDVDLVIAPEDRERSRTIMRSLGFDLSSYRNEDYGEDSWFLSSNSKVLIEVHTNLVHSPRLRQTMSLGLEDIMEAGEGDPLSPTAMVLVAAVHGAASHQFDRLQQLVDVALSASKEINLHRLSRIARRRGLQTALSAAFYLAARAYPHTPVRDLAKVFSPPILSRLPTLAISPTVVLRTHCERRVFSSWRRKAFRQLIKLG